MGLMAGTLVELISLMPTYCSAQVEGDNGLPQDLPGCIRYARRVRRGTRARARARDSLHQSNRLKS